MREPKVTLQLAKEHGLTEEEYSRIVEMLGREPNYTELGIFSVMWSEHCSYKSSKIHLKDLPIQAEWVIQGPGENAGIVDIGDGLAAIFKMESHNHPSFIEPYQGAATGVGGILRDIFTMGARPIASLNSLRFGPLDDKKHRYLLEGVVAGIAGYGNTIGVPTVGGEIYFHSCYSGNILVNVFTLGIARADRIFKGRAEGVGNPVIYVGSKTGRDGIHGVTMASEEFTKESEQKRPNVQVGDPFTEKLLMEACLELMKTDYLVGIQDMGGAGLTCSSFEMASRGKVGIILDLSRVPRREEKMIPYEVMLSESQERMLLVVRKKYEGEVKKIFEKWDLDCSVVGIVTEDRQIRIMDNGKEVAALPVEAVVDNAPIYHRPMERPKYLEEKNKLSLRDVTEPDDLNGVLLKLLSSPTLASKEWVYRQYDHMVRTNTIILPGSDASVLRVKDTDRALALTVDCNSRYCFLNPFQGAMIAVAEASRNLASAGAKPLGITDCLNFGNPEKPEIMWQFYQSIQGIKEACERLNIPVVGGNVSFYNETKGEAIYPTPTIAMVGLLENWENCCSQWFKNEECVIILLGCNREELGGSEYLYSCHAIEEGPIPMLDLNLEWAIQKACIEGINKGFIESAHDCSEGGLAFALAECCIGGPGKSLGAVVEFKESMRPDCLLFGETQSRIIISVPKEKVDAMAKIAESFGVPFQIIGVVKGDRLNIKRLIDLSLVEMKKAWGFSLEQMLGYNGEF